MSQLLIPLLVILALRAVAVLPVVVLAWHVFNVTKDPESIRHVAALLWPWRRQP